MSDGKLDLAIYPLEKDGFPRSYIERHRIFEDIRRTGRKISKEGHAKRKFNLIKLVDDYPGLAGSANLYNASFWTYITEKKPTVESALQHSIEMIKLLGLDKKPFQLRATKEEMGKLAALMQVHEDIIINIMTPKINSETRGNFDEVFACFGGKTQYLSLKENLDFNLFAKYFEHLSFYIAFYRYSMLTGNFHALVSVADFIYEMLDLIVTDLTWLESSFRKEMFHVIHLRVFGGKNDISKLTQKFSKKQNDESLALNRLIYLLKNPQLT